MNKIKNIIVYLNLIMICQCILINAQIKDETQLQQVSLTDLIKNRMNYSQQIEGNKAVVNQTGESHLATIIQNTQSNMHNGNEAYIYQYDLNNQAKINQSGVSNSTVVEQSGASNNMDVNIIGSNNQSNLIQTGINNEVISQMISNGIHYDVKQLGNNNQLIQKEDGASQTSYSITQKGSGMKVQITNGSLK